MDRDELNEMVRISVSAFPVAYLASGWRDACLLLAVIVGGLMVLKGGSVLAKKYWRRPAWNLVIVLLLAFYVQGVHLFFEHSTGLVSPGLHLFFPLVFISAYVLGNATVLRERTPRENLTAFSGYSVLILVLALTKRYSFFYEAFLPVPWLALSLCLVVYIFVKRLISGERHGG